MKGRPVAEHKRAVRAILIFYVSYMYANETKININLSTCLTCLGLVPDQRRESDGAPPGRAELIFDGHV